jgi:hypothetical protein
MPCGQSHRLMNTAQICGSEGILPRLCPPGIERILNGRVTKPAGKLLAFGNLAELFGELTGSDHIA